MSLTVAVPTFNNPTQLRDTLLSLVANTDFTGRIIVVNNGEPGLYPVIQGAIPYDLDVIDMNGNAGWMGGINEALRYADTDLFCMLNDDVIFPPASVHFWDQMLRWFDKKEVGGVGPASNYVAGWQSAHVFPPHPMLSVQYLIGFCAVYRTEKLKGLGALDESLPGGDDLDLSIRMIDDGFQLIADRRNYLHHHGGQTGQRVFPGQWDSKLHQADTYNALIKKHGLKRWYQCVNGAPTSVAFAGKRATGMRELSRTTDELAKRYYKLSVEPSDMDEHMGTLYRYASVCDSVVETGTNDCTSTTALLYAQPKRLDCFDIQRFPDVDEMERLAGKTAFTFHLGDVLTADFPECDMWFCDDFHEGVHVATELALHAHKVRKYCVFHDVSLFAEKGEAGGEGIWKPISEYFRGRPEWSLVHFTDEGNGLAIFARNR